MSDFSDESESNDKIDQRYNLRPNKNIPVGYSDYFEHFVSLYEKGKHFIDVFFNLTTVDFILIFVENLPFC